MSTPLRAAVQYVDNPFHVLREQIDLAELAGRYTELKSSGRALKGSCPNPEHPDPDPSCYFYPDGRFYCFGCGLWGDVIDLWAAVRGIEPGIESALDLAQEYRVELPDRHPEAESKVEERRKHEAVCMQQAEERHKDLERHPSIQDWWRSRGFDEELQRRYLLGANADGTAATIPYWHRGRVLGIILRYLKGKPKYLLPTGNELPDGHKSLFMPGRIGQETYIVEGFIDGLALDALGECAVAIGGTHPNETQLLELERLPTELYVLFDEDHEGEKAARKLAREIYPKAKVCPRSYGKGISDPADLCAAKDKEEALEALKGLKKNSRDLIDVETTAAQELTTPREQLKYANENIIPLICDLQDEIDQLVVLDILTQSLDKVQKGWLKNALQKETKSRELNAGLEMTCLTEEAAKRAEEAYSAKVAAAQDEIDELLESGVLKRFREDAAEMHGVVGDEKALEFVALVVLGAQLKPLPNERPIGPSALLSAPAGRGKNYLTDAVLRPLPEEFYKAFEVASAQAFYYAAEKDPTFLKHKFVYPNELEAVDALIEFLRPMLSGGKAVKFTVNKDASGANVAQELVVEGPITTAIPTIRNKTDEQLHTRLLVGELPDYEGRVKAHCSAASELLLPDFTVKDNSRKLFLWRAGLRQLAEVRRVVFPLRHPDFALDNDDLSHGARTWTNLLGLMCAHGWLEQRNRDLVELPTGERAIVATPWDYRAAYEIFKATCTRTIVNLSKTHRKIVDAVYTLKEENPERDGFSQRGIAKKAGISQALVSKEKTFLTKSAKLLQEGEHGLILVAGAEPSWWHEGDVMAGFPTPNDVQAWWDETFPPDGAYQGNQSNHLTETDRNSNTYAENDDHQESNHQVIISDHDHSAITQALISENRMSKTNPGDKSSVINPITDYTRPASDSHAAQLRAYLDSPPEWFTEQARKCINEGKPERLVKPLASSIAADCLGDPFKWREALPAVGDKLKEMA
jgi:DNA primase